MSPRCDVAIIGAGPYGLSVAAHLHAAGVNTRVFGKPLGTWREHMPKNMTLKSDGFASNLSAPARISTLKVWCERHRRPYANQGLPVEIDDFLAYGSDFIARYTPVVEDKMVEHVETSTEGYRLVLDNGEQVSANRVVVAAGISCFPYTPPALTALSSACLSHSYDHREGDAFAGKDVVIVGAGASAIDLAALLHDCGAKVRIVVRAPFIEYNSVPDPDAETLFYRIRRPASGIGRGWSSYFCANAPVLFYRLPEPLRRRGIQSHMHPAAGWFMREKIEGRIETLLEREIAGAEEKGSLRDADALNAVGKSRTDFLRSRHHRDRLSSGHAPDGIPLACVAQPDRFHAKHADRLGQFRNSSERPLCDRPGRHRQFRPPDAVHGGRGVHCTPPW